MKNSLSSNEIRRKSMEDSPLDALFQMASKTFEGLKAKSGKTELKIIYIQEKSCLALDFLPMDLV